MLKPVLSPTVPSMESLQHVPQSFPEIWSQTEMKAPPIMLWGLRLMLKYNVSSALGCRNILEMLFLFVFVYV